MRRLTTHLVTIGAFADGGPIPVSAGGSRFFDRVRPGSGKNRFTAATMSDLLFAPAAMWSTTMAATPTPPR